MRTRSRLYWILTHGFQCVIVPCNYELIKAIQANLFIVITKGALFQDVLYY